MRDNKYEISDLSTAFFRAISEYANPKYVRQQGAKILFNGFWRNGDKQNICAWIDKATWHDAKTGDGGGCKEFAKIAFGLDLPEFLRRFGDQATAIKRVIRLDKHHKTEGKKQVVSIEGIWQSLLKNDVDRSDPASSWLSEIRGFSMPRRVIGSGFANFNDSHVGLFDDAHAGFLRQRLTLGPQLVVPIRGVHSEDVQNLFFRSITDVDKQNKSRLLPNGGGWHDSDQSPRAFGFPSLINEFPNLVICEGMADYFAAEYLLLGEEKYLPLGAPSASFLPRWANWLISNNYRGRVIWVYQLDVDENNKIHANATGQRFAVQAAKILREAEGHSELFNWAAFLKAIPTLDKVPKDLADMYSIVRTDHHLLTHVFQNIYSRH